ncbi:hypothetical protein ARMGADRAFT_1063785 [Armillaria gallica]|uniref:Uncharacterized protein n=1 Tax=Armillaria gallica TaxID=47427 RepID=A0A2H3D932_ARMGA|nr:hypothetical protein ARMGADRAFT_1063785 [Armillaria gallica]
MQEHERHSVIAIFGNIAEVYNLTNTILRGGGRQLVSDGKIWTQTTTINTSMSSIPQLTDFLVLYNNDGVPHPKKLRRMIRRCWSYWYRYQLSGLQRFRVMLEIAKFLLTIIQNTIVKGSDINGSDVLRWKCYVVTHSRFTEIEGVTYISLNACVSLG